MKTKVPGYKSRWLTLSLFGVSLSLFVFGLLWLSVARTILTGVRRSTSLFEITYHAANSLFWLTGCVVVTTLIHELIKSSRRYLYWPLIASIIVSAALTVIVGVKELSFGPFVQPGTFYPPFSMPDRSFSMPRDYYLLALFLANCLLIIRLFLEGGPSFLSSPKDHSDVLDALG